MIHTFLERLFTYFNILQQNNLCFKNAGFVGFRLLIFSIGSYPVFNIFLVLSYFTYGYLLDISYHYKVNRCKLHNL